MHWKWEFGPAECHSVLQVRGTLCQTSVQVLSGQAGTIWSDRYFLRACGRMVKLLLKTFHYFNLRVFWTVFQTSINTCTIMGGFDPIPNLVVRGSAPSPTVLLSISLIFYPSTPLPDTAVHPRTHTHSVFLSSKLSHLVKEHSPLQTQLSGTCYLMDFDTPNLLLHLKQLSNPIFSGLLQYLTVETPIKYLLHLKRCTCLSTKLGFSIDYTKKS